MQLAIYKILIVTTFIGILMANEVDIPTSTTIGSVGTTFSSLLLENRVVVFKKVDTGKIDTFGDKILLEITWRIGTLATLPEKPVPKTAVSSISRVCNQKFL